jgi:large subunit ribosomal protein L25
MATVTLEAQLRTERGKGAARALRREGFVPGIIYGHGEETRACKINAKEFERLVTRVAYESTVIDLKLDDGNTPQVLIRDIQIHPYRPEVLHVDFLTVRKGEKVKLSVPVHLTGVAAGVKEGGILEHLRHEVEIRTIPSKIPEALEIDVTELTIGDQVTVADLTTDEEVEILAEMTAAIAQLVPPIVHKIEEEEAEEVAVEGEEEVAEPEVVGRGKAADEEEAAKEEQ